MIDGKEPRRDEELTKLLDEAKKHVMTSAEVRAQAISFAYGNLAMHDSRVMKEDVEKAYDELYS